MRRCASERAGGVQPRKNLTFRVSSGSPCREDRTGGAESSMGEARATDPARCVTPARSERTTQ